MRLFALGILVLGLTSCKGYFFLNGSADSGPASLAAILDGSNNADSDVQPIIGSLAINLSNALEEKGIDEAKVAHIIQAASLAARDSKTAVTAAKDFLGGAIGSLQVSNTQVQSELALTDDTDDVFELSSTIMDSSYKTTGSYLAENGNTGAEDTSVDADVIDSAIKGMAGETLNKLQTIVPVTKLTDAVKAVMSTTSSNASAMHNKSELAISESQNAFKSVMQGIFSAAKEIKDLDVEDVADAVVSTLAVVIKKQNIASSDATTLVVGMSTAIVTTVAADKDTAAKSSTVALKVLDVGIQSLTSAGVKTTNLASDIGTLVEKVSQVAISSASKSDTTLVKQIAATTQKSAAIVANSAGLNVADFSKAASEATKKAVFTANSDASTTVLAALSAQINEGEKQGLTESKVVSSSALTTIVAANQEKTASIIASVTKPIATPAPSTGGGTTVSVPTPPPIPAINKMAFYMATHDTSYTGLYRTMLLPTGNFETKNLTPIASNGDIYTPWLNINHDAKPFPENKIPLVNGKFLFSAFSPSESPSLWATDGIDNTPAHTVMLRNDLKVFEFGIANGLYLFLANDYSMMGPNSVWRSDGTVTGTYPIFSGPGTLPSWHSDYTANGDIVPMFAVPCGGFYYFLASTGDSASYYHLFKTNGNSTYSVNFPNATNYISQLRCARGKVFAETPVPYQSFYYLYRLDSAIDNNQTNISTATWTEMGRDDFSFIQNIIAFGPTGLAGYGGNKGNENAIVALLGGNNFSQTTFSYSSSYGPAPAGAPTFGYGGANATNITGFNNRIYFTGDVWDSYLYTASTKFLFSDGTPAGVQILKSGTSGTAPALSPSSGYQNVFTIGSMMFLAATEGCTGSEPWVIKKDPSNPANVLPPKLLDINQHSFTNVTLKPGCTMENDSSSPSFFIDVGGFAYFDAKVEDYGRELFFSDGTDAGTRMIGDLNPSIENGIMPLSSNRNY